MKRLKSGFTLIELLVIITVVSILLGIVLANLGTARQQSRDAERQTDMQNVAAALELYKQKYGQYPAGCNGVTTSFSTNWSGQVNSVDHACGDGSAVYIIGLAPEFLPELPIDPRLNGDDSGYVYTTNTDRSVYKFMALNTVEGDQVDHGHEYFRCGADFNPLITTTTGNDVGDSYNDPEICERIPPALSGNYRPTGYGTVNECNTPSLYRSTYAVSAGFSDDTRGRTGNRENQGREYDTEIIRCK